MVRYDIRSIPKGVPLTLILLLLLVKFLGPQDAMPIGTPLELESQMESFFVSLATIPDPAKLSNTMMAMQELLSPATLLCMVFSSQEVKPRESANHRIGGTCN